MRNLLLPCRYYRVYTDTDVACVERNFHFVERDLPLPVAQTALILVDGLAVSGCEPADAPGGTRSYRPQSAEPRLGSTERRRVGQPVFRLRDIVRGGVVL